MAEHVRVKVNVKAYAKLVLHAAKYPHSAVNGVLLADKKKLSNSKLLYFVDCVPLFHQCLGLAPMLETALLQIDSYCKNRVNELVIAGYYQANERIDENKPNGVATKIADKLNANCHGACLFMMDNSRLSMDCEEQVFELYTHVNNEWKKKQSSVELEGDSCLAITSGLLTSKAYLSLQDYDCHLDDITQSWLNPEVNKMITSSV
ncbi:ER membrane protein complex subunit 8-like [Anneissia japonica]|uniref:ER membrane protein complex subunit 8-like n=1 Tax=Anneissia japonica TaxID=1529436 RepID=UPI0014257497|nr:ER membrane protein complex subunit 8-like [Anneissia japonica]